MFHNNYPKYIKKITIFLGVNQNKKTDRQKEADKVKLKGSTGNTQKKKKRKGKEYYEKERKKYIRTYV